MCVLSICPPSPIYCGVQGPESGRQVSCTQGGLLWPYRRSPTYLLGKVARTAAATAASAVSRRAVLASFTGARQNLRRACCVELVWGMSVLESRGLLAASPACSPVGRHRAGSRDRYAVVVDAPLALGHLQRRPVKKCTYPRPRPYLRRMGR